MPLPNGQMGVDRNPLKESPFILPIERGVNSPPPGVEFFIYDSNDFIIFDSGDNAISD